MQMAIDASLTALALVSAYDLRFDGAIPPPHRAVMWSLLLLVPVVRPLLMWALGGYDSIWRYFSIRDAGVLAFSAAPVSIGLLFTRYFMARRFFGTVIPASVVLIEYGLFFGLAAGVRILRRVTYEASRTPELRHQRALLVGTEATLPQALRQVATLGEIEIVGLLAPESKLQGLRIGGRLVMETPAALPRLLVSQHVDTVLVADNRPEWIAETVATAAEFGADVVLLPSAESVIRRDVRISAKAPAEAALTRALDEQPQPSVTHPDSRVVENFRDRVVLITGAGGSIGSELARQVAALPVASLLLLDRDENAIFELSNTLAAMSLAAESSARIAPIVGDIRETQHLRAIFEHYRPHIVLHAAAYKHVPLMESNVCEAVLNNVMGSRLVAQAAMRYGAERFVMISTDKAVRPSSIMGASKRIAEMLVSELGIAHRATPAARFTRIACVRFGNVVGSRGSVVPIFQRQIAAGGPITITDEHMTRYFMTIPEASQLVLQAASLASDGDIYMLDMGDPVKITSLARKVIQLSGLRPDKDIEIRFVGARPGEKISEQLWHTDAQVEPTDFLRVLAVKADLPPADFSRGVAALEQAALARNESAVLQALRQMPIGFAHSQPGSITSESKQPSRRLVH